MSEEVSLQQPYVHLLEGRDPIEVLRATPGRLADLLKGLTTEQIEQKTTPGRWSVREVLCHLADCEIAWAWRLRLLGGWNYAGGPGPTLEPFDQDAWARAYDGVEYTTAAARNTWIAVRQWNLALVDGLSAADRQRDAMHPQLGSVTLWNVVEIAAGHDLHHVVSLEKLAAGLGS